VIPSVSLERAGVRARRGSGNHAAVVATTRSEFFPGLIQPWRNSSLACRASTGRLK
jgi:hypothetical protein